MGAFPHSARSRALVRALTAAALAVTSPAAADACALTHASQLTPGSAAGVALSAATHPVARPSATHPMPQGPFPGISATSGDYTIRVDSVTSTANLADSVTVKATVRNTSGSTLSGAKIALQVGRSSLDSRTAQHDWVKSARGLSDAASSVKDVSDIQPGATTSVELTVPSAELVTNFSAATLPVRLALTSDATTLASWRGMTSWWSPNDTVTPVETSIIVPLTLPANPKLLNGTPTERLQAWREAIGPGSRINQLLSTPTSARITWLIDPAVLEPAAAQDPSLPSAPAKVPGNQASQSPGGSQPKGSSSQNPASSSGSGGQGASAASSEGGAPGSTNAPSTAAKSTGSANASSAGWSQGAASSSDASSSSTSSPGTSGSSQSGSSQSGSSQSGSSQSGSPQSGSPSSPSGGAGVDSVEQLAARLRAKVADRPDTQQVWFTPYGDPDLSTLTADNRPAGADAALRRALSHHLSDDLAAISTTVVAAPAEPLSRPAARRLRAAWKDAGVGTARPGQSVEPLIVTPNVTVTGSMEASISQAARQSTGGAQLLGFDSGLSSILDGSSDSDASAAASARAQLMAVYQERPSQQRSLVVMGDRALTTPSRLTAVADALADVDWASVSAASASAPSKARAEVVLSPTDVAADGIYPRARRRAVDRADLATVSSSLAELKKISGSLENGSDVAPMWSENLDQVMSTRWRDHSDRVDGVVTTAKNTVNSIPARVHVVPSQINFFTDSGRITVTVKNDLARAVNDLKLVLRPRSYTLHFHSQPEPFSVPANSQAGVRFETSAQAASVVQVTSSLTGAGGVRFDGDAESTKLTVNARPTSSWIFWGLGIVALGLFCYGIYRNVQKGTRRRDELARDIKL